MNKKDLNYFKINGRGCSLPNKVYEFKILKKKSLDFPEFFLNVYEDFINKNGFKHWIRGESSKKKFGFFGGVYEDFFEWTTPRFLVCIVPVPSGVCVCVSNLSVHTRVTHNNKKRKTAQTFTVHYRSTIAWSIAALIFLVAAAECNVRSWNWLHIIRRVTWFHQIAIESDVNSSR